MFDLRDQHAHCSGAVTDTHLARIAAGNDGMLVTFDATAAMLAQDLGARALLREA